MSDQPRPEAARTKAAVRRSWWPGWIWAIPIAVLLVIAWLAVRALLKGGEDITISFDDVHGLQQSGTNLIYRGMTIGKVSGIELAKDGRSVEVTVHVDASAAQFLTSGTEFWLRGANPSFSDLSSLGSVLSGPSIVMEPGPGKLSKHFVGLTHEPVISGAHGPPQLYEIRLTGSVGGLKQGAPVKLRGFAVGEVRDVGFRYNASTGELATPVTLALYPPLFHIEGAAASDSDAALKAAVDRLIRQGLRARLQRDPPVIGTPEVALDIEPGSPSAAPSMVNGVPQIPAAPGGGIEAIVNRINKVPIDQISQNLLDITRHVDTLVSSSKLDDAINQLDAAVRQIDQTVHGASPKITELVNSLRQTAAQLDSTTRAADKMLGGTPSQNGTQQALREITEAARSVRELADYLDRHPEALIQGRSGE